MAQRICPAFASAPMTRSSRPGSRVLVGVDVASTYCYLLSLEEHRDADTWGVRLLELVDRGFQPQATIADFAGLSRRFLERSDRRTANPATAGGPPHPRGQDGRISGTRRPFHSVVRRAWTRSKPSQVTKASAMDPIKQTAATRENRLGHES